MAFHSTKHLSLFYDYQRRYQKPLLILQIAKCVILSTMCVAQTVKAHARIMRDFHATNWTKSRYGAVIITFKIQRVESYPVSISLPHAQLYLGSGFNPLLQRNAALPVDGLRLNIRGISPVKDSALNRCSSVHVQLSSST